MLRLLLVTLKRFARGLAMVVLLLGGIEAGLRMADFPSTKVVDEENCDDRMVAPSPVMHHALKRRRTFVTRNPDTGRPVKLVTNSFGLRGREPSVPKPPGVFRIICLGDETVLGQEVNDAETFPGRLQQILQSRSPIEVDVINAGVPGYCPLLSYLQVRHSLLALQPDLLILNFDMSDVADDYRYRRRTQMGIGDVPLLCRHPSFGRLTQNRAQGLVDKIHLIRWSRDRVVRLWVESVLPSDDPPLGHPRGKYAWLEDNPPDWSLYVEHAFAPIEHLKSLSDGAFAGFIVATYPAPWQVSATASAGDGVRARAGVQEGIVLRSRLPFEALSAYLREHGIPFCDTSPAFLESRQPDSLFLQNAPQFSEQGHALYAEVVANCLTALVPRLRQGASRMTRLPDEREPNFRPRR